MNAEYTGRKIAELRKAKNLTQKELAELVHVTDKAVSKWERGVNFPDLGLLEDLANHLGTTPSLLLGLEDASRDEIVASFTELSAQQAEDAASDIQKVSWLSLAVGILLFVFVMFGFGGGKLLFYGIADFLVIGSVYMLHKYGAIHRWELMDIVLTEIIGADIVIYLAVPFFTGSGLHWLASAAAFGIAAVCLQLLFYRVMKPYWAKVIPVVAGAGMACWGILLWLAAPTWQNPNLPESITYYGLPLICSLAVWTICRKKDTQRQKLLPALKPVLAGVLVPALCIMIFCQPAVEQTYVKVFHRQLESYASELLQQSDDVTYDDYGPWDVTCLPDSKQVEFHTGSSGFGPETAYCGFYYSPDDTHRICFQAGDLPLNVSQNGNLADWYGEGDNWGKSTRLMENWFWFEVYY